MGSTLLALDAGLNLERNFAGNRDWAFRVETAKPECMLCFASVQVKDNRKFLLAAGGADLVRKRHLGGLVLAHRNA